METSAGSSCMRWQQRGAAAAPAAWDPASSAGDYSDAEAPAASERSAVGPVLIVHDPPATCRLCQTVSTSLSPLPDATNEDRYGGLIPWQKYQQIPGGVGLQQKRPVGKQCLVCLNVYRALGRGPGARMRVLVRACLPWGVARGLARSVAQQEMFSLC